MSSAEKRGRGNWYLACEGYTASILSQLATEYEMDR